MSDRAIAHKDFVFRRHANPERQIVETKIAVDHCQLLDRLRSFSKDPSLDLVASPWLPRAF